VKAEAAAASTFASLKKSSGFHDQADAAAPCAFSNCSATGRRSAWIARLKQRG